MPEGPTSNIRSPLYTVKLTPSSPLLPPPPPLPTGVAGLVRLYTPCIRTGEGTGVGIGVGMGVGKLYIAFAELLCVRTVYAALLLLLLLLLPVPLLPRISLEPSGV